MFDKLRYDLRGQRSLFQSIRVAFVIAVGVWAVLFAFGFVFNWMDFVAPYLSKMTVGEWVFLGSACVWVVFTSLLQVGLSLIVKGFSVYKTLGG